METCILVLTAAGGVRDAVGSDAARALAAAGAAVGAPRRLARSAIEMSIAALPDGFSTERQRWAAGVDANFVATTGRRKRLLIADMDSTIIGVECIDELADYAGLKREVAAITEAAMRGELDFEAALTERVRLLAGLSEATLEACHAERVHLNPGARTLVQTMARHGAEAVLVSGGFTYFAERVAAAAGFARSQANRLMLADGRLSGEVARPILGREAKLAALETELRHGGFGAEAVIAVGDGANDLDMVRAAGLGVAYRAKPALAEAADARIVHSDLTALLALQGIAEDEWATG